MQYINYLKELIGYYFQQKQEVVFIEEKVERIQFDRNVEIIQYRFQKRINKETQTIDNKKIRKRKWEKTKKMIQKNRPCRWSEPSTIDF